MTRRRSLELSRRNVCLMRLDRRRLLHRFSRVRHLGGGVEVELALRLAVGLRLTPANPLCRTTDVVRALSRPAVERLGRPERHLLERLSTIQLETGIP